MICRQCGFDNRVRVITTREKEVWKLIADGLSLKEAAFQMGIAYKTAVNHRWNLAEKLGAPKANLAALVRIYMEREAEQKARQIPT